MNILFLAPRVPHPPNKGDKIRSHHLMRRIATRHTVHIGCLLDEPADAEHAEAARGWAASVDCHPRHRAESVWRGATGALTGAPLSVGYFHSGQLAADVRRRLAGDRIDVAVAYCSSMAPYLERFAGPRVVDFVDVDSLKWTQYARRAGAAKRPVFALEGRLLRGLERRLTREFDRCVIISAREREMLAEHASVDRVDVVTNGVETEFWGALPRTPRERELIFVGALDYFANADGIVDFARRVLPAVRDRVPGTTLRVVGRRPGPAVRALSDLPGVDVVGEVDDVRPELARATVAVAPLRIAQGLQNKVLEAMAAGVPVVSSPSAVRAIEGEDGRHYAVADEVGEWASRLAELLEDGDLAARRAREADAFVRERFSWDVKAREFEAVLERAVLERAVRDHATPSGSAREATP